MISQLTTTTLTDRSVLAVCPLGLSISFSGIGLSATSALMPVLPVRERSERPTGASAVAAAKAQAQAYSFAAAANGAGVGTAKGAKAANGHIGAAAPIADQLNGQQKQHGTTWAFRGLEPWSDPA